MKINQTDLIITEYKIPIKNVKRKVIYHISDCHISEYDDESTDVEIFKAKRESEYWLSLRSQFTREHNQPICRCHDLPALDNLDRLLAVASDGDAVILTGDIMDYVSQPNVRILKNRLSALTAPYLYVRGNHEPLSDMQGISEDFIERIKRPFQAIELDGIILVGIDNADRVIDESVIPSLKRIFDKNKPVIVAMHVPIMTDSNEHLLSGENEYFRLNHSNAPASTDKFISLLRENAENTVAVLAGHLHAPFIGNFFGESVQIICSQGISGNINKYIIGE
ncbi:MAG: metallophosphoesterase [Clostridia bacterium]|nr:metallophosphoesterase [Clostridia bacterium]